MKTTCFRFLRCNISCSVRDGALCSYRAVWMENQLTVEGDILHERVDEVGPRIAAASSDRSAHGVGIRSLRFGITGKVDVVEFPGLSADGIGRLHARHGKKGHWTPHPVQARGSPKARRGFGDDVQVSRKLCAWKKCWNARFPRSAIYYASTRKRREIAFRRSDASATAGRDFGVRALISAGVVTPPP